MSREKQIEEMAFNLIMATSPLGVKDLTKQFDYKTVAIDLYEQYGWRKQSEWISVEERLPKQLKHVIVCDEDGIVGEAFCYKEGRFEWIDSEEIAFVTHWMPLPEPPKMKGENDDT